jgi:acetyl-CoA acetyltransferase
MMVQTGAADAVLVVGVESMSNIEYYTTDMRWGSRAGTVSLHDRLQRGRELLHELGRRRGRLALETMCIGGGQGLAAIFSRD